MKLSKEGKKDYMEGMDKGYQAGMTDNNHYSKNTWYGKEANRQAKESQKAHESK